MKSPVLMMVAAAFVLAPDGARACGGFFCSQVPMDQAGEQILFAVEGEDVTAHVQIQYEGDPTNFSWVLPIPTLPEISVGTDTLFTALRAQTDPRFEIQWNNPEGCNYQNDCGCQLAAADGSTGTDGGDGTGGGGVSVLAEGDVGPFTYKVVESEDGNALFDWLNENGYDQPAESEPLVGYYVNQSYVFVAIKLQSSKGTGDIQPLVLKYTAPTLACVPLKLTSIAATPDMPVYTWVLAKARAVPLNFFHVTLNPKAFDWLNCGKTAGQNNDWCGDWNPSGIDCDQHYTDLVTKAADAANGHAFVTEYAGTSSVMSETIWTDGKYDLAALQAKTTPGAYIQELLSQQFPRNALMQEILKTAIPKPEAVVGTECEEDRDFYRAGMIDECLKYMPEDWTFDVAAITADVDARIVQPLKDAQQLFADFPYTTRLFTTISADEMTKDPMFSFNPDLPDVSNVHTAVGTAQCKAGSSNVAEKVTFTFADGAQQVIEGEFQQCNYGGGGTDGSDGTVVAAEYEIQVLNESGPPERVAASDVDTREAQLDMRAPSPGQANVEQNPDGGTDGSIDGTGTARGGNAGCTAGGTPGQVIPIALLLMLALLGLRFIVERRAEQRRPQRVRSSHEPQDR